MATHDSKGNELILCSRCKCRRLVVDYELDRHGHRQKGCIPCKQKRLANPQKKCEHNKRRDKCAECKNRKKEKQTEVPPVEVKEEMPPTIVETKHPEPPTIVETKQTELFKCSSNCRKSRTADQFGVDQNGNRLKVCKHCREQRGCQHVANKYSCHICSPQGNERAKRIRNVREFTTQKDGWPFIHIQQSIKEHYDLVVSKWMVIFNKMVSTGEITQPKFQALMANLRPWTGTPTGTQPPREIDERAERTLRYFNQHAQERYEKQPEEGV
jgi:hypothetical protein